MNLTERFGRGGQPYRYVCYPCWALKFHVGSWLSPRRTIFLGIEVISHGYFVPHSSLVYPISIDNQYPLHDGLLRKINREKLTITAWGLSLQCAFTMPIYPLKVSKCQSVMLMSIMFSLRTAGISPFNFFYFFFLVFFFLLNNIIYIIVFSGCMRF